LVHEKERPERAQKRIKGGNQSAVKVPWGDQTCTAFVKSPEKGFIVVISGRTREKSVPPGRTCLFKAVSQEALKPKREGKKTRNTAPGVPRKTVGGFRGGG